MRRRTLLAGLPFAAALPAARAATAAADKNRIKVGVRGGVDEEIFEVVTRVAARDGLTIDSIVITGTVSPNEALNSGEIDANSFQHVPFLNSQIKARGYRIVSIGNTYVSPVALYSRQHRSLAALPEGARLGIPDDVSNQTRALVLLHNHKLIRLKDGFDPYNGTVTLADVAENPRRYRLTELNSIVLARSLQDLDGAVIVNTYAFQLGLLATRDGIAVETAENNPYINIIAVRPQDKDAPWAARLLRAYQSPEVRDFLARRYQGSVLPVF